MTNFNEKFSIMNEEYEKLYQLYYDFKSHTNRNNKMKVIEQISKFNKAKNDFTVSVKNLFLGGI